MYAIVCGLCFLVGSMILIIYKEYKYPAKTVAWLVVQLLCPLVGFVLYMWLGKPYPNYRSYRKMCVHDDRYRQAAASNDIHIGEEDSRRFTHTSATPNSYAPRTEASRLVKFFEHLPSHTLSMNNEVVIYANSQDCFQAILKEIAHATRYILFQFYTIRDDEIGRRFQEVLVEKAKQGVIVRVIYDSLGSYPLSSKFIQKMKKAGIEISEFLPIWSYRLIKKLNYRNHRKVVVIDGKVGFLGGMNIGDEYLGGNPYLGFWRDTHIQVKGGAVLTLHTLFVQDWFLSTGKKIEILHKDLDDQGGSSTVQVIESGPDLQEDTILELFFSAITTAKESIYISTPYFIPDPSIRFALQTAARSGLDVRLILPDKIDSRFTRYASESFFEELLASGVKIYKYQKGFMHAKVMIVDHELATVGSANMDWRSFYANFEVIAVLFDRHVVQQIEQDFWIDMRESVLMEVEQFKNRPWTCKKIEKLARLFSPFL